MTAPKSTIRDRARDARRSASQLVEAGARRRVDWLVRAAEPFCTAATPLGKAARDELAQTTGLTAQMIDWGLCTTLETVRGDRLLRLIRAADAASGSKPVQPVSLLAVVLAGNVFAATVRAIFVPLLFGVPVVVKVASRESSFAYLLQESLHRADSVLARAIQVVAFRGGDESAERSLFAEADAVSVYGTDETIEAVRRRLGGRIPLITHGHGISVAVCGRRALLESEVERTIAAVALDVAAYDQRGCLSPQVVYVQESERGAAEDFAERLSREGLAALSATLPRGSLPPSIGAAQAQWRGAGEVQGSLFEGIDHAVVVSRDRPPRWSPGYRNVTVTPIASSVEAVEAMSPFEEYVKSIGVDADSRANLLAALARRRRNTAYVCEIGSMQTPSFDSPADGRPPWEGLLRIRRR